MSKATTAKKPQFEVVFIPGPMAEQVRQAAYADLAKIITGKIESGEYKPQTA